MVWRITPASGLLLCCKAALVQVEKLSGLAQDGFNLHQDQTLLMDPTLCGLEERQEVPVDRGKTNFRCGCFGHRAPPAKQTDESSVSSKAVMRNGLAKSLRHSRFRSQMDSSIGINSDCLSGCATRSEEH